MLLSLVVGLRKRDMFKSFLFLRRKNNSFFAFSFFLLISNLNFTQVNNCSQNFSLKKKESNINQQKICSDLLKDDLSELYEKIIKAHPNPFIFCSKEAWDEKYQQILNACNTPKTFFEFSKLIASWLSMLQDSHTSLDPDLMLWEFKKHHYMFPFMLSRIKNKFYAKHFIRDLIPHGNEILKINEFSADSLFNLSICFAIKEGESQTAQNSYATYLMGFVYNICNDFHDNDSVVIKHVDIVGDTIISALPTYSPKERKKYFKKYSWNKTHDIEYKISSKQNIGILKVNTFSPKKGKKYESNMNEFFKKIKKRNIENVLIDLRDNTGGYFYYVNELMDYIDTTKLIREKNFICKRSFLDDYSNMSFLDRLIFKISCKFNKDSDFQKECEFYNTDIGHIDTLYETHSYHFKEYDKFNGTCFLAINGMSISASVDFTSWFMKSSRGLVLGEPCMGPYSGTWGNPRITYLSNTKLAVVISTIRNNLTNNFIYSKIPIRPDIEIPQNINDYRKRKDPIIKYLFKKIL